jgi:hypothetical protein
VQTSRSTISCLSVLVVILMMSVELLVEQYCEPTQSLCPCDHAFIYASSYFSKTIILATSPFSSYFICPKQEPRFIFETKLLSKLSIYKIIETYKVEWSHYFYKLIFC